MVASQGESSYCSEGASMSETEGSRKEEDQTICILTRRV